MMCPNAAVADYRSFTCMYKVLSPQILPDSGFVYLHIIKFLIKLLGKKTHTFKGCFNNCPTCLQIF